MKNFTVEETNLMCCFNTSSRKRLIDDMKSVTLNDMDGEIAEMIFYPAESWNIDLVPGSISCLRLFRICYRFGRFFYRFMIHGNRRCV